MKPGLSPPGLSPPEKVFLLTVSRRCFFCGSFLLVMLHVSVYCAVVSVPCSIVVTCWKKADLWDVMFAVFVTFPNVSWSISELRARLAGLSPPVKYVFVTFQGGTSLVDHLCFLCLVFLCICACSLLACGHLLGKG